MSYTTQNFLDAVNRRSFLPSGQNTFEDAEILAIGDEITRNEMVPSLMKLNEEFFVQHISYNITQNIQNYLIPDRAIGMIVREVSHIDTNGAVLDMDRIEPTELDNIQRTSIKPEAFFVKNDEIWLHPIPANTTGNLRIYFPLRPGNLVETSEAATVTEIDTATDIVTISTPPASWVTGNVFDFISNSGAQKHVGFNLTSDLVSGSDITFSTDGIPEKLKVGDYIALQGESPLVQLPSEYRDLLAQGTACFIMEKMNLPGHGKERDIYTKNLEVIENMISPRTQGSPRNVSTPDFL